MRPPTSVTEIYLDTICSFLHELLIHAKRSNAARNINETHLRRLEEYDSWQQELSNTDLGRGTGGERGESEDSVRR